MKRLVVYLDGVFALNAVLDGLLLSAAGRLTGRRPPLGRLLCAAALGGGYAAAAFLPGLEGLSGPVGMGLAMVAMVAVAFRRRLLGPGGALLGLSCGLAGGLLVLERLLKGLHYSGGLPGSWQDGRLLLLSGSGVWALVCLWLRRRGKQAGRRVPVLLELGGKQRLLTALVDSGNGLTDPISGRGVLVVEWDAVAHCLPPELTREVCRAPAGYLEALARAWPQGRLRLVPCRTVQTAGGVLLAATARRVQVDGVDRGSMTVAIAPVRLSGGEYQALIGM